MLLGRRPHRVVLPGRPVEFRGQSLRAAERGSVGDRHVRRGEAPGASPPAPERGPGGDRYLRRGEAPGWRWARQRAW